MTRGVKCIIPQVIPPHAGCCYEGPAPTPQHEGLVQQTLDLMQERDDLRKRLGQSLARIQIVAERGVHIPELDGEMTEAERAVRLLATEAAFLRVRNAALDHACCLLREFVLSHGATTLATLATNAIELRP